MRPYLDPYYKLYLYCTTLPYKAWVSNLGSANELEEVREIIININKIVSK